MPGGGPAGTVAAMESENAEPAQEPKPVQGHPTARYSPFEKILKKVAKVLRQSR
jgi:hypothetical protein